MYVDDNVIAAPNKKISKQVRNILSKVYPLKDLSEATRFLSFQIIRDRVNNRIFINQTKYAKAILARFRYEDINPIKTPIACFNYLTTSTRPDMTYTVGKPSQANASPSKAYLRAMKHLFRHLKGTVYYGINHLSQSDVDSIPVSSDGDQSSAQRRTTPDTSFMGTGSLKKARRSRGRRV
uniref:Fourf gag pol protein n=1 Tax=Colletotrichum fructicola (strain Nara gc5) TaxID=1213859 RepID=L2FRH2_COLFN